MPRRHYADRLTYAEEAELRRRVQDAERRCQALSRRLDVFMAGGLLRRMWAAAWRGEPPVLKISRKGEAR